MWGWYVYDIWVTFMGHLLGFGCFGFYLYFLSGCIWEDVILRMECGLRRRWCRCGFSVWNFLSAFSQSRGLWDLESLCGNCNWKPLVCLYFSLGCDIELRVATTLLLLMVLIIMLIMLMTVTVLVLVMMMTTMVVLMLMLMPMPMCWCWCWCWRRRRRDDNDDDADADADAGADADVDVDADDDWCWCDSTWEIFARHWRAPIFFGLQGSMYIKHIKHY